jgi:DNA-binding LacI/PurR family transcriptional regulator
MVKPSANVGCVRTDENAGTRMAIEHLASLGHRTIAHVDGGSNTISADRRNGYQASMTSLGLGEPLLLVNGDGQGTGGESGGEEIVGLHPRPTAVVAFNDETAWGVMRSLARAGLRVPDDISVVGYDGSPLAQLAPVVLTTIRQDSENIARHGVLRAIERLEQSSDAPTDELFAPAFVPGDTTGPPPGSV